MPEARLQDEAGEPARQVERPRVTAGGVPEAQGADRVAVVEQRRPLEPLARRGRLLRIAVAGLLEVAEVERDAAVRVVGVVVLEHGDRAQAVGHALHPSEPRRIAVPLVPEQHGLHHPRVAVRAGVRLVRLRVLPAVGRSAAPRRGVGRGVEQPVLVDERDQRGHHRLLHVQVGVVPAHRPHHRQRLGELRSQVEAAGVVADAVVGLRAQVPGQRRDRQPGAVRQIQRIGHLRLVTAPRDADVPDPRHHHPPSSEATVYACPGAAHPELIPMQSMCNASPSRDGDPQLVPAARPCINDVHPC